MSLFGIAPLSASHKFNRGMFKKLIGKIHLFLGLGTGVIVILLSVTGCMYAFRDEIFDIVHHDFIYINSDGLEETTLPLSQLWDRAQQALGNQYQIKNASTYKQADKAWMFRAYQYNDTAITYFDAGNYDMIVYINPYSGEVQGIMNHHLEFFQLVKMLHWSLWLNTPYGQPIIGYSVLIFVISLITGLILWWPKNKAAMKQRFSIHWKARWRRINYDLHNVPGFYSLMFALILATTGLVWSFQWVMGLVYFSANMSFAMPAQKPVVKSIKPVTSVVSDPFSQALVNSWELFPEVNSISLSKAKEEEANIDAYVKVYDGTYYKSHRLQFDQYTAELLQAHYYHELSSGEKLINMNYDIHIGAIGGIWGKILAFIVSFICGSLPISGFIIWWGRKNKVQKNDTKKKAPLLKAKSLKKREPMHLEVL